jgi:archaellum component FlaC
MPGAADQAQQLADLFTKLADEVDAFRNAHYDDLSAPQRAELEEKIQQLYDFHDRFAGDAIQNTIEAMQGDLGALTKITGEAKDALQHLKTVERVVNIVSAASTLAEDIVTADYGAIPEAVRGLAQSIQTPSDKSGNGK